MVLLLFEIMPVYFEVWRIKEKKNFEIPLEISKLQSNQYYNSDFAKIFISFRIP